MPTARSASKGWTVVELDQHATGGLWAPGHGEVLVDEHGPEERCRFRQGRERRAVLVEKAQAPALDAPGKGLPQRLERSRQQLALGQRVHGVVGVWLNALAADPDDVAAGAGVAKELLGGGRSQRGQIDTENHGLAGNVVRGERFGCQYRGPERAADRAAGSERSFQVEGIVGLRHLAAAGLHDRQRYLLIDARREIEAVIQC